MHEFTFLFKIEPAGDFGLPERDIIVTKARPGIYTASIDRLTFNAVSHGTLSHYREENESVGIDETVLKMKLSLRDNYLSAVLLEEHYKEAEAAVLLAVDRFVQLLALDRGTYFSAEFLQATVVAENERKLARKPARVSFGTIKTYNLQAFKESLTWAFGATCHSDMSGLTATWLQTFFRITIGRPRWSSVIHPRTGITNRAIGNSG
jgi:hypothetical protein